MEKATAYLLLCLGTLGFLFFLMYGGTAIPEKEMWFVLSLVIAGIGGFWVLYHKWRKTMNDNAEHFSRSYDLRQKGEKIRVTLDNCEVKSRTYFQEIINGRHPSRIEMLDSLHSDNSNYKTWEVLQTYIVYYKKINGTVHTFVSQPKSISREAMKQYLEQRRGVDLYFDKNDATIYMFDLPNL
ncbi:MULTISPECIES: hypothetical protein [Niastella]|uniref:Uncharacterized protein n=1 Tax=Niastella soli TaxID=2821487 RepID=A0ABS3Z4U4_9BACT|nr:hypothetical protein [Niastella soli]MBO9205193.1 hypothetical protein [Niastella soli]